MTSGIVLGVQRESLGNNPLLQKSPLGRPLKRCFILPPEDFVYGRANEGVEHGAGEALSGWYALNKPQPLSQKEKQPPRDFIRLNRQAVRVGLVTAPEHFQYRATHDIRQKLSANEKGSDRVFKRIPPTMVFGLPTKPSTPVFELLGHKYQDRWLEERKKAEELLRARQVQKRHVEGNMYETRASLLRKHQPPVEKPPLWHMRRFERVPGKLETFRTESLRTNAFQHHATDCTSRTGVFGHGIYEGAKS